MRIHVGVCPKGWVAWKSSHSLCHVTSCCIMLGEHFMFTWSGKQWEGVCLPGPCCEEHKQRKPLAECCHYISPRQIYGYSFAEEWPSKARCTFSSLLLSCTACCACCEGRSLVLPVDILHSQRERSWEMGLFLIHCPSFTPWPEKCDQRQGQETQRAAGSATTKRLYWNILSEQIELKHSCLFEYSWE